MAYTMGPFPLRFGSRGGGGGDPTAITPANADAFLTALGVAQTGTATTWGETGQPATPHYEVAAGKVPLAYDAELGVFGPIVNPAGTNLALYDRDGTNAAWVKTNCTVESQTSSLSDAGAANGHILITATADNATCLQSITSTSGERVTKWWAQTEDEGVFVSHGATTGSALYEDDFSSNTSGEWTIGQNAVDISATVSGGELVITRGALDAVNARMVRTVSGFTVGKPYKLVADLTGEGVPLLGLTQNSDGGGGSAVSLGVTGTISLRDVASATTMYVAAGFASAAENDQIELDNVSIYEIAETELIPGSNPVPVNLDAATFANPQLGIRLANSGDSVRLYGVVHQVADRPLRPYIGPTAGSTVTSGARTMIWTLSESPSLVSLKILFRTPTVSVSGQAVFSVDDNAATNLIDLKANGSGGFVLRKVIASSETAFSPFAVATNTLVQVDVEISASVFRYRIDGGSWVNGTAGIPGSLSRFRTGHDNANAGQLGQPILAIDEMSEAAMMDGLRGWNKEALA